MDNLISLDARREILLQRRADEYLLDLVKDETAARWSLIDHIVHRPEFTGSSLTDIGAYLDGMDAAGLGA